MDELKHQYYTLYVAVKPNCTPCEIVYNRLVMDFNNIIKVKKIDSMNLSEKMLELYLGIRGGAFPVVFFNQDRIFLNDAYNALQRMTTEQLKERLEHCINPW